MHVVVTYSELKEVVKKLMPEESAEIFGRMDRAILYGENPAVALPREDFEAQSAEAAIADVGERPVKASDVFEKYKEVGGILGRRRFYAMLRTFEGVKFVKVDGHNHIKRIAV